MDETRREGGSGEVAMVTRVDSAYDEAVQQVSFADRLEDAVVDGRIVVSHLTKFFGEVRAVDDLSFTVDPGSVMGFLGSKRRWQDDDAALPARPRLPDQGH